MRSSRGSVPSWPALPRGFGGVYANVLAQAGSRVVVNGTTRELVEQVVGEIRAGGGEAIAFLDSVASFEGAGVSSGLRRRLCGIDILVNNAGVIAERMMFNTTEDEFRGPMQVRLLRTFACSLHAARDMRQRGWGRIINTGDVSRYVGHLGGTNVAAAKASIHAMALTWAVESRSRGIAVNRVISSAYTRMHDPLHRKTVEVARERGDARAPTFEERGSPQAPRDNPADRVPGERRGQLDHRPDPLNAERAHCPLVAPGREVQLLQPGGFTIENLRRQVRATFGDALEPVGRQTA